MKESNMIEVYAFAYYLPEKPEDFKIDWYPSLFSMQFVLHKMAARLPDHKFEPFTLKVKENVVDKPITNAVRRAYVTSEYTEIEYVGRNSET